MTTDHAQEERKKLQSEIFQALIKSGKSFMSHPDNHNEHRTLDINKVAEFMSTFILADRRRVLDEVEKAIKGIIKEAHDGIKDDYCYVHEVAEALSIIQRLKG